LQKNCATPENLLCSIVQEAITEKLCSAAFSKDIHEFEGMQREEEDSRDRGISTGKSEVVFFTATVG